MSPTSPPAPLDSALQSTDRRNALRLAVAMAAWPAWTRVARADSATVADEASPAATARDNPPTEAAYVLYF